MRAAMMVVAMTFAAPGAARGASLNHAHVKYYGWAGCCQQLEEGPSPVLLSVVQAGHELGWYSTTAAAAPGNVMVWGRNYLAGNTGLNTAREMEARSSFDDLVFTDGTGVPKPVTFWIHLDVSGSVEISTEGSQGGCLLAGVHVTASPTNQGGQGGGWGQIGPEFSCPYPSDGFFTGESGAQLSKSVTVGPFDTQSEQPLTITLRSTITPAPKVPWGYPEMTVTGQLFAQLSQITAAIESPGFDANSAQAHIVNNVVTQLVSVESPGTGALQLAQSVPNPARAGARIAFELPRAGEVQLALFDVAGREVRRLAGGWNAAGTHTVQWDGRDTSGRSVPPGIYLYRLRAAGAVRTRPLVVTR